MRIPVLCYHAMNVAGPGYAENDHAALAADLETIRALGLAVVPVHQVVDALLGEGEVPRRAVALSFDDGSWFDWHDLPHPSHGMQRGFAGILRDFRARHAAPVHGTSFVIVSPEARAVLDRTCMIDCGWWTDGWWADAAREGLVAIENHSWDHNHATLPRTVQRAQQKGTFATVDVWADADAEIRAASDWLDAHLPAQRTTLFAYPYGDTNDYLVRDYFPRHRAEHRIRAAFTTEPAPVTPETSPWRVPRYVCGSAWQSPEALAAILRETALRG